MTLIAYQFCDFVHPKKILPSITHRMERCSDPGMINAVALFETSWIRAFKINPVHDRRIEICRIKTELDREIRAPHPDRDAAKDKDRVKVKADKDKRGPAVEIDREAAVKAQVAAGDAAMDRAREIR